MRQRSYCGSRSDGVQRRTDAIKKGIVFARLAYHKQDDSETLEEANL